MFKRSCHRPLPEPAEFGPRTHTIFLEAFEKLRKATISFVTSVRPYAWNNSDSPGQIFMKFDMSIFRKFVENIQVRFKSDKINGYFTSRRKCISGNFSMNSSSNERCLGQKLQRKSDTHFTFSNSPPPKKKTVK